MLMGSDGAGTIPGQGSQAAFLAKVRGQVFASVIGVCPPSNRRECRW
jgi:hypothetical protein